MPKKNNKFYFIENCYITLCLLTYTHTQTKSILIFKIKKKFIDEKKIIENLKRKKKHFVNTDISILNSNIYKIEFKRRKKERRMNTIKY